mgnify:CR=1 FL=1
MKGWTVEDLFRPAVEFRAAVGWLAAAGGALVVALTAGVAVHLVWVLPCVIQSWLWARRGVQLLGYRMSLGARRLLVMPTEQLRQYWRWAADPAAAPFEFARGKYRDPTWWLGTGFVWSPSHATLALEMASRDQREPEVVPPWARSAVARVALRYRAALARSSPIASRIRPVVDAIDRSIHAGTIPDKSPLGQAWIHALSSQTGHVLFRENAMQGHTFVVGAPGSGKTRLYEVVSLQAVHAPGAVIVIDPKFDQDWEARLRREAAAAGKPYVYFNLAKLSQGARIDVLKNWHDPSEIASRVAGLLQGGSKGETFVKFAELSIDRAVKGLLLCEIQPTLRRIKDIVERGVGTILAQCLDRVFTEVIGSDWRTQYEAVLSQGLEEARGAGQKGKKGPQTADALLGAMMQIYLGDPKFTEHRAAGTVMALGASAVAYDTYSGSPHYFDRTALLRVNETLSGLITSAEHNKEHYGKMITTLLPLLNNLCSGEVGEALSPDPLADDPREIWDIRRAVEEDAVVYLGLNTLANRAVGQAVGSMLLADAAAVVGYQYNNNLRKPVTLFVDEAAEVANPQFVQILNKGRGAGWRVYFASQTIADFETKLGSAAEAMQVLGNANNFICGRVQDMRTREYMSQLFGETRVFERSVSSSSGAQSDALLLEFNGSVSHSNKKTKAPLVHPDLLGRLANMHYFAAIEGGNVYKLRVPILI